MPISSSDIQFLGSGFDNLGGAISLASVSSAVNAFFDPVYASEAASGDEEYRCFYIKNNSSSTTLTNVRLSIDSVSGVGFSVQLGLGTSAINGVEQIIPNENTPPLGVTFSTPTTSSPLVIGNLSPGQHKAVWVKRIINASCPAQSNVGVIVKVQAEAL